jgi:hypothetical protein
MPDPAIRELTTFSYYDPRNDCEAVRLVAHTGHGTYWIAAPVGLPGRQRRERRAEMIDRLEHAILSRQDPGEVSMTGPRPQPKELTHGTDGEDRGVW